MRYSVPVYDFVMAKGVCIELLVNLLDNEGLYASTIKLIINRSLRLRNNRQCVLYKHIVTHH